MSGFSVEELNFLPTLISAVLAHGLGHLVFARVCGIRFSTVGITHSGFRLRTDHRGFPSYQSELLCAVGGPIGNLASIVFALLLRSHYPSLAPRMDEFILLSLYLAGLNLLPIRGFDGARILECLLCLRKKRLLSVLPDTAERIVDGVSLFFLSGLWFLSVYLLLRRGSGFSLFVFCLQLFRTILSGSHGPHSPIS